MIPGSLRYAALAVRLALPLAFLELCHWLAGAPPSASGILTRMLFVAVVLAGGLAGRPARDAGGRWRLPWPGVALATGGGLAAILYGLTGATLAAWALTAAGWAAALWLAWWFVAGTRTWLALPLWGTLALAVGAATVALELLETRFSEEEFFAALAALILAAAWALILAAWWPLAHHALPASGLRLPRRRWIATGLLPLAAFCAAGMVQRYQTSFFPPAPPFPGISAEHPTICEQLPAPAQTYAGQEVYARLLALVAANPARSAPEYGMLALGTGNSTWAAQFRAALLEEAATGRFSEPANSVKYGQFEAAKRVYYYDRVRARFPELFSAADDTAVRAWFAAVHRRALTVEWVDWLYALAFGIWPAGPYENQESGAGLLAILQATGLGDPALAAESRAYLERAARGWAARWRNNDDTYYYQTEWITNAYYQAAGASPPGHARRSFDWLLLQAPPGGAPVSYNFPYPISPDGPLYLGATLFDDPRYLWVAAQAIASEGRVFAYASAQPGADGPLPLTAVGPTEGSCLIYGDSGTPTRPGPLGPDKLVFRSGWQPGDAYLLLNLRFTGWHRYKATNTITLAAPGPPLLADQLEGEEFGWLPRGRSAFRDERVPREHLNGLVVPRSGMSAVRFALSGLGGPWAQDPPPFARVERFEAGPGCDISVTTLEGWRGWEHRRTVRFCDGAPVVIADEAAGQGRAALMWNLATPGTLQGGRVRIGTGEEAAELVLLPLDGAVARGEGAPGPVARVAVEGSGGRFRNLAVLLSGPWVGAEVRLVGDPAAPRLRVEGPAGTLELGTFGER
ncbi:MAG: hypothetical protein OHK0015_54470 [Chloroflexi bacterium OHK40]